jgi:RecB family endonuclease NucS
MGLWKITDKGPQAVHETKFKQEKMLEEHLEDWICSDGTILSEPLFIIGRQVIIPDVKDRLDLLALDPQGNSVIIELKRGKLRDPVDMQALRYASYIAKWKYTDFENIAQNFLGRVGDPEFNFNSIWN